MGELDDMWIMSQKNYFKREGQLLPKFDSNKLDKSQANQQTHLSLLSPQRPTLLSPPHTISKAQRRKLRWNPKSQDKPILGEQGVVLELHDTGLLSPRIHFCNSSKILLWIIKLRKT